MLDVYIAEIDEDARLTPLSDQQRQREIDLSSSKRVRAEKYFAWRLLEYALHTSVGISMQEAGLRREDCGRWICNCCNLSISHGGGFVAVALSDESVGVDIQPVVTPRAERFAERVLTSGELFDMRALPHDEHCRFLITKWTEKESIFKSKGSDAFIPNKIETCGASVLSDSLFLDGQEYILAVASDRINECRIIKDIELSPM